MLENACCTLDADPHHCNADPDYSFIKVMRISDHWFTAPFWTSRPPLWASMALRVSILTAPEFWLRCGSGSSFPKQCGSGSATLVVPACITASVVELKLFFTVPVPTFQCCGSGSGIRCLFDPWIRDPGWVEVSIRIRDEQPGSYFLELRNHFFWVKILKFFDADPGWRPFGSGIRDGKKSDPG